MTDPADAALHALHATAEERAQVLAELPGIRAGIARLAPLADGIRGDSFADILAGHLVPDALRGHGSLPDEGPGLLGVAGSSNRADEAQGRFNAFTELFGAPSGVNGGTGPLAGAAFAYKDAFATAARAPTVGIGGGHRWSGPPSASLQRLEKAGALAIGATNLDPHCYATLGFNLFFGRTLNPRDPRYLTGGSSSGSAAAVAAGVVSFALGTDTGGSARIPAALTGVYGFKPTHGRIVDKGMAPLGPSQDSVGILGDSAATVARVFAVLSEAPEPRESAGIRVSGLRVGVDRTGLAADLDPDVAAALDATLRRFAGLGAAVVDVPFPALADLNLAASVLTGFEAARVHGQALAEHGRFYPANIRRRLLVAAGIGPSDYAAALRLRAAFLRSVLATTFAAADILVAPVMRIAAPRADTLRDDDIAALGQLTVELLRLNRPFNLLGLPSIAVPAGSDRNGMPVGLQLVGPPGADEAVIALAAALSRP